MRYASLMRVSSPGFSPGNKATTDESDLRTATASSFFITRQGPTDIFFMYSFPTRRKKPDRDCLILTEKPIYNDDTQNPNYDEQHADNEEGSTIGNEGETFRAGRIHGRWLYI